MIQRNFIFFLVVFLSVSMVSGATYHGSFNVDVGTGSIVINPDGCVEDWSSSFWGNCVDGEQIFICFDKNSCGTTLLKPAQCGETQPCGSEEPYCGDGTCNAGETCSSCPGDCGACPPITPPSGSGGSGSSSGGSGSNNNNDFMTLSTTETKTSCIEKWGCDVWSNIDDSCGVRVCEDLNSCGTQELKPKTSRECPSGGLAGITGRVIGGITALSKSKAALSLIFILVISALVAVIALSKRKANALAKP